MGLTVLNPSTLSPVYKCLYCAVPIVTEVPVREMVVGKKSRLNGDLYDVPEPRGFDLAVPETQYCVVFEVVLVEPC